MTVFKIPNSKPRVKPLPTFAQISALLEYDQFTGHIRYKVRVRKHKTKTSPNGFYEPGEIAGVTLTTGYLGIYICGHSDVVHRIAWLLHYKKWPEHQIDHINKVRCDNRIVNLRSASKAENSRNRTAHKNNRLGVKGVTLSTNGKYIARIRSSGKLFILGRYDTIEEAKVVYDKAAKLHFKDFAG